MKVTNLTDETEDFTGNVWLISRNSDNSENVLIDVGTGDSWDRISQLESVSKVVITHSHYDHVDNLPKVVEKFGPKVYAYEPGNLPVDAEELDEGDTVELAGSEFEIFHTPGHKDDSICLYSAEEKVLFTGDLIFPEGGFGRTDLEDADCSCGESACSSNPEECCEGDRDLLIESIEKVVDLDVERFYSGHEDAVTEDANKWINRSLEEAEKHEPKY